MYDVVAYETILKRMLDRLPDDLDKREGSVIFDALAPTAVELQNAYIELDWILDQMFADTSTREYLIKRAADSGEAPHPATKATLKGEFDTEIELGTRFSLDTLNYVAVEKIEEKTYRMECETAGVIGNKSLGSLIPVYYISGLKKAELTEILTQGVDEESTSALRERLLIKLRKPSTSGNKYDYYNWAMECVGVGATKIFPLASGPGTVKVVIADTERQAASQKLVEDVSAHIEELRPIGATVSVVSAVEKAIDITARIRLKNGINLGQVQEEFTRSVASYLKESAFDTDYVSVARIGTLLLDVPGVEDFNNLMLNDAPENVPLTEEEIAVAGAVVLEVM